MTALAPDLQQAALWAEDGPAGRHVRSTLAANVQRSLVLCAPCGEPLAVIDPFARCGLLVRPGAALEREEG